jgi:hypothetical protein
MLLRHAELSQSAVASPVLWYWLAMMGVPHPGFPNWPCATVTATLGLPCTQLQFQQLNWLHLSLVISSNHLICLLSDLMQPVLYCLLLNYCTVMYSIALTTDHYYWLRSNYSLQSVCQSLLVLAPPLWPMTRFFLFFSWTENFLVLKWGTLSDKRTGV